MNRLSEESKNQIINLYKTGMSPKEIGEKYGIWNNSVTRILKKAGIERNQLIKVPEDIVVQIVQLYNEKNKTKAIADKFNLEVGTVCRILKRNGINLRKSEGSRKYIINENIFSNINNEISAYFLGLFYADACLSNNLKQKRYSISLTLKSEDRYMLQTLSKIIYGFDKTNLIYSSFYENEPLKEYYNLTIYSKKIYNDLIKLGCIPQKSHKITFPQGLINKENIQHFIRGYLDGDGCISESNERVVVDFVSTEMFLLAMKEWVFNNLNIEFGSLQNRHKDRISNTRSMRISAASDVILFLNYIYENSTIFLKRKMVFINVSRSLY